MEIRLCELLGGRDGRIPDHLAPVADALLAADKPRSVLVWLGKSPAAQLLAELAASAEPITHEVLDALPPSRSANFVRSMLLQTGVLPARFEHLDRFGSWLDALLESSPAAHARLIRPYAQWHVVHRARRRAQRRGRDSSGGAAAIRHIIRVALEFLTWLDEHEIRLHALAQQDVDSWLAGVAGSRRRYLARGFLMWAVVKQLAPKDVAIPALRSGKRTDFIGTQEHELQLHRCLHDPTLPPDIRAAGALILLFGLRTTDVLALRSDQINERPDGHYLQLGDRTLPLPPQLAALLTQLPVRRTNHRTVLPAAGTLAQLLFPGFNPIRPIDRGEFGARMLRHGITPQAGRNTALLTLAAELPTGVLADLVGIHDVTAARWARTAKRMEQLPRPPPGIRQ